MPVPSTMSSYKPSSSSTQETRTFTSTVRSSIVPEVTSSSGLFSDRVNSIHAKNQNISTSPSPSPTSSALVRHTVTDQPSWTSDDGQVSHEVITRDDGTRIFQLHIDAKNFNPEDLTVKVQNGTLKISGTHEERSPSGSMSSKSFSRSCTIPSGVQQDQLNCSLDTSGRMIVSAPIKEQPQLQQVHATTITQVLQPPSGYKIGPGRKEQVITVFQNENFPNGSSKRNETVTTKKTVRTFKTVS